METIAEALRILGVIVFAVGAIWLLVVAFKVEVPWGVACILIPCASLVFLMVHWDKAWKPFAVKVAGVLIILLAEAVGPPTPEPVSQRTCPGCAPHGDSLTAWKSVGCNSASPLCS